MKVKDKVTGKILTTKSVWLMKQWKLQPKRYLTNFIDKKPKEEVVEDGIHNE